MSNAMKYIRELEAAGFPRNQAEAQVEMILDAVEGDMNIKNELVKFNERMNQRFIEFGSNIDEKFNRVDRRFIEIDKRFAEIDKRFIEIDKKFVELEFRITTRLGFLMVSTTTIAVAVLAWLIKIQ